jgi:predicted RNA polymerase sigma factor
MPRPWLISTGRFKAIDVIRRRARFDRSQKDLALHMEARINEASLDDEEIEDDRLRLIFTCCHPALPPEGQVALTLREICGLTTEEIARAFLVTPATLAQRIVRAKAVIRDKAIPYQVPVSQELSARLGTVLLVVYLIFNAGYSAETTGAELSREAIRLGRLLLELLQEPEVMGLLGLMLLHESRRQNLERRRLDPAGAAGSVVVEQGPDRRGHLAYRERSSIAPLRCLHFASGYCGRSRREFLRGIHGLAADCAALRPVAADSAVAGCRIEPRGGHCDV